MNNSSSSRDYSLDNIRFILIFLVVFAHLLEICTPFSGSGKIYKFIYSFHMPAFIFLFGYNARFATKKIVYRWCVPYVVFQCAYLIFAKTVLKQNVAIQFTTPYWLLWYMLACIFYQLLLPMLDTDDKRKQILAILSAFTISILIGYENTAGYYVTLSRFFVFQPWFILGYYCKKNSFFDWLSLNSKLQIPALTLSALVIILLTPYIVKLPNGLLYGSYSYTKCKGTFFMRASVILMALSMILFIFIGSRRFLDKKSIITKFGQNTWSTFLLHGFAVKAIPLYCSNLVSSPWKVILLTCAIVLLTGNKWCSTAVRYISFAWIERTQFVKNESA